jgi:hypothetical protein
VALTIRSTPDGYAAFGDGIGESQVAAETLMELVRLLSAAGCHSTDISGAVDAAGLDWPGGRS